MGSPGRTGRLWGVPGRLPDAAGVSSVASWESQVTPEDPLGHLVGWLGQSSEVSWDHLGVLGAPGTSSAVSWVVTCAPWAHSWGVS